MTNRFLSDIKIITSWKLSRFIHKIGRCLTVPPMKRRDKIMDKKQITKELERLLEWDRDNNILVAIRKNDIEIATYYIGVTDKIGIDSKDDSVTVSCIERNDIVPTMIRIICDYVTEIKYFTPEETKKLMSYECEWLVITLKDGYRIDFTTEM